MRRIDTARDAVCAFEPEAISGRVRGAVRAAASGLLPFEFTPTIPPIKTAPTAAGPNPPRVPVVTPIERTIAAANTAAKAVTGVGSRRSKVRCGMGRSEVSSEVRREYPRFGHEGKDLGPERPPIGRAEPNTSALGPQTPQRRSQKSPSFLA